MNKKINLIISFLPLLVVTSCNKNTTFLCLEDTSFGGIYLDCSISEFNSSFTLGDSLKLEFSNGQKVDDIPYFNGYYGKQDTLIVCSYPNSKNPGIHRCQGPSTYKEFNIDKNTTVKVSINQKEKYKEIQDALNLEYSNDINKYDGDKERFANFYVVKSSKLKDNLFYRSCSPCNNKYNRAKYASELLKDNNIHFSINLSDSEDRYNQYKKDSGFIERSSYYDSFTKDNNICFLETGMDFKSDTYCEKVANGLSEFVIDRYLSTGPDHLDKCHFHCDEGKDRTGFFSFLILSLVNTPIEEIEEDYMKTYYNYYGIDKKSQEKKYNIILNLKLLDFAEYFKSLTNKEENYLQEGAIQYLLKGGLTNENINKIIKAISK